MTRDFIDHTLHRFIIVGIINTLFGSFIMFSLYNVFGVGYWLSSSMNYILASILSFFLNKYYTFTVRHWSVFMVLSFIINISVCYLIAYSLARPIIYRLLSESTPRIRDNIALFVGMCLYTGLNYLGQRYVVFRRGTIN